MAENKIEGVSAKKLARYFEYLDALRQSGITNMYGASPYLVDEFRLDRPKSVAVLSAWMKTFDGKQTPEDRAAKALAA